MSTSGGTVSSAGEPEARLDLAAYSDTLTKLAAEDEALYALAVANLVAFVCQPSGQSVPPIPEAE